MERVSKAEQKANCLKLADYLENEVATKAFSMPMWTNKCGSRGCALGHAVMGKIIPGLDMMKHDFDAHPTPAICNAEGGLEAVDWSEAGPHFFGDDAYYGVFTNRHYTDSRQPARVVKEQVIAHLRRIGGHSGKVDTGTATRESPEAG